VDYEPGAESPLWEELISQWIGNDVAMRQYLHRLMGYSVTGDTREEILVYIYGPPRSGKGTFLNTIHAILGPMAASTDMETFIDRRGGRNFALASLIEARFVQAQETRTDQWLNTALLKSATGRDPLSVEQKYKTPYTAVPVWKIMLASNYPPKAPPDDTAFWETRMRVISFPHSNSGSEDKTLKARLLTEENKRGIASWLVRGAMNWYRWGLGAVPTVVTETTQQMRSLSDSLGRWLNDACVMDPEAESPAKQLHTAYTIWCDEEGIPPAERHPQAELTRRLTMRGLTVRRTTVGGRGGTSGYLVRGIKLS
jgi:putative DNA primase/helicase